jgi:catechol 2,3-dioxygenase-like lactoylglutathione lyase family enzyme
MEERPPAPQARARATEGRSQGRAQEVSAPFSAQAVDHVTVTAPEELFDEVASWYETGLGLERVKRPSEAGPTGVWLRAGDQEVHIDIDPHNPPHAAHFALVVNDLRAAVQHLRHMGCHIEQARTIPGRRRFFTRDPAGNRVEIVAYGEGS